MRQWSVNCSLAQILGPSVLALALGAGAAHAQLTPVANANPKTVGFDAPNVLSPELVEVIVAQGSTPLENGSAQFPYYGYDGNGPHLPPFGSNVEATKTEPDKNTYLVFAKGLSGPDASYDYGTHFLFQGHENGVPDRCRRSIAKDRWLGLGSVRAEAALHHGDRLRERSVGSTGSAFSVNLS